MNNKKIDIDVQHGLVLDEEVLDAPVDELSHYGVLGMKWGKRKYQNKDGSLTDAGKKKYSNLDDNDEDEKYLSNDAEEYYINSGKNLDQLSNAQIRKINERIRLEQEYKNLNPSAVKKGLDFVGTIARTGENVAKIYSSYKTLKPLIDQVVQKPTNSK